MKLCWPLALMFVIFLLSSVPGDVRGTQFWLLTDLKPTVQNTLHVPLYGLLQWLWMKVFRKPGRSRAAVIGLSALVVVAYGICDELHQAFVPGRYAAVQDVLLNIAGVLCAALLYVLLPRSSAGLQAQR